MKRRELKLKRVNDTVILVADSIITRIIKNESEFDQINELVNKINSGLLSVKEEDKYKLNLLNLMMPVEVNESTGSNVLDSEIPKIEYERVMKRVAAIHENFEYDELGFAYLKGFSVPIPMDLAHALLDAKYNPNSNYTVDSLINFWKWALLNPNSTARNDLFRWFKTGSFSITDGGMVVAYRCVAIKKKGNTNSFNKLLEQHFLKVKKWKKSPKNYAVVGETIVDIKKSPDVVTDKNYKGNLAELYADIDTNEDGDVYTDNHTRKMTIKIGEEVRIPREDCDENQEAQCSRGLHFMSKKYSLRLGEERLIVLVNPMDIVAFPSYDQTKGRSCAYFPVSKALLDDTGDIDAFDAGTYDFEYVNYSNDRLNDLFKNKSIEQLQEEGLISKDVTIEDLQNVRSSIKDMLSNRTIDV